MSFPRYAAYKDSGANWLGEVPQHWRVAPLRSVSTLPSTLFIDGDWIESKDLSDEGVRYITTGNVGEGRYKEQGSGYITPAKFSELACTEVLPGDVLISRLNPPIGRSCLAPNTGERLVTSVDNVIVRPNAEFSRAFLVYMLSSKQHFANMENLARGTTMQRIGRTALGNVRFAFPPENEQHRIAAYLDRETTKVGALVNGQTRLIELLREKRRAVISRAVTKGLNPAVPLKDPEVQWLGRIPAHWDAVSLKRISPSQTVGIVVNPSMYVASEGLPFLYGGDIREGRIDLVECRRISAEDSERNAKTRLQAGDLVTVRVGAPGVTAVVPQEAEGGNCASVMLIRRGDFDSRWLCYTMNDRVVRFQVEIVQYGAAQEQFNISHAVEFILPRPSRDEQTLIANHLDKETARLDDLVTEAEAAMRLLVERRAALISAAVTGKIDVRDLAPQPEAVAA